VSACPSCGRQALPGERFCGQCGAPLARVCPSCGAENPPDHRFCGSCGTALTGEPRPAAEPVAERRLVSVLFTDLVGFTALSEHRDPEEVRELLSRYFDRCRTLIERYGGTVEKFIGDAVMAVWGTPVAREDDAERAVRAALALVQRVQALGEEVGMPELRVRAGVLTGHAAVEVGAEGEGMVLGDAVNTASRLQSIAAPGMVLVDDATRRAAEAAIAFEDAGTHDVKGRERPVHAWTALRVVAGAGGARRGAGLEAPFVGRQPELQTIIEAGEESAQNEQARLIAVVGDAGSGKSRLLWEFFKYLDGIKEVRYWHQGRCLSYGEGVAYWALAEMVRARARIQEEEEPAAAREKLRAVVERHVPDERERRLVEPRLAHLLRLDERPDSDRADLFSGWRLFFERLSQAAPVILAFEDLQWADSGLLDFVDYLLEWSAEFPIFVLALGRPELGERRPAWRPLTLEALEPQAIVQLLEGLAPGLPAELVAQVVERAEGIPLYAVETIRMLQDRGALVQEGARYVVKGDVSHLEVPETLHALVASRLDGLSATERSLLQDAAVIGQSFTAATVAALSGLPEAEVTQALDGLVAKQVLARDDDPRSPERGQYLFLQALLRTVAYGTLGRRARKAKHLAAARHLEQTWPGEARDIAEVLASHYLEAIRADPEAQDVATLRGLAREKLTAAGQAAASLALGPEADRYFEQAAELADQDAERAELLEQAGHALWKGGDGEAAESRLRRAIELYRQSDDGKEAGAVVALARLLRHHLGRLDDARSLLERFLAADNGGNTVVRAQALAELSAVMAFSGELDDGLPLIEEALTSLEHEQAWAPLADALVTRGIYLMWRGRREEGAGVLRHALALADEYDATPAALRARMNLTQLSLETDQVTRAVEQAQEVVALARERGDRALERKAFGFLTWPLAVLGRWDEAASVDAALIAEEHYVEAVFAAVSMAWIAWARGDEATLERCRSLAAEGRGSTYVDTRICAESVLAREALERGEAEEALRLTQNARRQPGISGDALRESYEVSVEAAIALGEGAAIREVESFVADLPRALATPLLRSGRARLQAELAHLSGDDAGAWEFEDEAIYLLRSVGARALLAPTLLERARRHKDPDALAEARSLCEELKATRWLERVDELSGVAA
jgi:class 3 adenylate cyclase/tetratricopeptide (TPR) repeat protein